MRDSTMPLDGFDQIDPEVLAALTCHIEMEVSGGKTPREVANATAEALRLVAAKIENGQLDTGHHPIMSVTGQQLGELYLDFFGEG